MRRLAVVTVVVLLLIFSASAWVGQYAVAQLATNPCPDGQFSNLSIGGACQDLAHPEYGYQPVAIPDRNWTPGCNANDVQSALDAAAAASGGTVQLPACTIAINEHLRVGSNTQFIGDGAERTIIRAESDVYIFVEDASNVVVSDLTMDAQRRGRYGIRIERSENVLLERMAVLNAWHSNIRPRFAPHLTIRYSAIVGARDFHGWDGKDCFGSSVDEGCKPESEYWSVYSNRFERNGGHGANPHSSYGELAGNVIVGNGYGVKTPDAHDVVIAHNLIQDSGGWGFRAYRTYDDDADRKPYAIIVSRNHFVDNDTHVYVEELQRDGVHLVYNEYAGRGGLSIKDERVHGCPNSEDVQRASIAADSPYCGRTQPITPTPTATATKPGTVPPTPTLTPTATPFHLRCWELPAGEGLLVCENAE